ncbi:TPA: lipopolysaccharide transport periplasmic protein LptA [Escherichia coli]|nr:lipopolysaccharide transport periplasmic protein LptA [Escherichia coli]
MKTIFFGLLVIFSTGMSGATVHQPGKYTIDSDRQEILPDGNIRATGHVHVVNGDMVIDADEAVYYRRNVNLPYITAKGKPVTYSGVAGNGKLFSGRAEEARYTINTGEIVLTGNACIRMERDRLSADIIRYNVNSGIIVAVPRPGNRVRSIIDGETVSRKN